MPELFIASAPASWPSPEGAPGSRMPNDAAPPRNRAWTDFARKAVEPLTSYPETYAQMNRAAREQIGRGIKQLRHVYTPGVHDPISFLYGIGNIGLGTLGYVGSPLDAALRTFVGKPVEDATGVPKEYSEFGLSLINPGLASTKLAMLGGMAARTFPWNKLGTAEGLEKAGRSADEIWQLTGLERGADGYWRFEISDRGYKVNPNVGTLNAEGYRVAPLYEQQRHQDMRQAYPDLWGKTSALKISPGAPERGKSMPHGIEVEAPDLPWARYVGSHELQHMIDRFEGHARGGSPDEFLRANVSPREAYDLYWRLAGEAAARNAQYRMSLSELERSLLAPQRTESVPRRNQIILFDE